MWGGGATVVMEVEGTRVGGWVDGWICVWVWGGGGWCRLVGGRGEGWEGGGGKATVVREVPGCEDIYKV